MGWTRGETDVAEMMIWLRGNHGRARRRVWTTRYMREGHGDEFSARDAMSAARAAMTSVKDMHRHHLRGRQPALDRPHGVRHHGPSRRRVHHEGVRPRHGR
jgi:hypothetical protein